MNLETKNCQNCKKDFNIKVDDFSFYEKIKVPPPTFCPECRLVRRLSFRNERALYKRKCDLCGKDEILMFPAESPYKVFCFTCWWSDNWNALDYGRDYDFSKPFFEQYRDLLLAVPRPGSIKQGNMVGSLYTNRVSDLKNCYLVFGCNIGEDGMYSSWVNESKDYSDCFGLKKSERCYECIDCTQSYDLSYSEECVACTSSSYLYNCRNCQNCFGCVNLRGANYHIFNQVYQKEEYERKVKELKKDPNLVKKEIEKLRRGHCVPFMVYNKVEKSIGNWLEETKRVYGGFSVRNVEDGAYLLSVEDSKDVMDYCYWGRFTELIYEAINCGRQLSNLKFANECWNSFRDSTYVMNCHTGANLFGCVGMRGREYCIFNKQYSKEEYESLVPKIIEHMNEMPYVDKKGRIYKYGEFFPYELSPFAYNETIAQDYFPITLNQALNQGFSWKDVQKRDYKITRRPETLPFYIEETSENILEEVIGCANDGKAETLCTTAFRVTEAEFNFYKKMGVPVPKFCPNCRHFARLGKRVPVRLWHRTCMCEKKHPNHEGKCKIEFETSYAPERPEVVYCERCYQQEVY